MKYAPKTYRYTNLADVLGALIHQVNVSIPFCRKNFNFQGYTPESIYYYLKELVNYKRDPKGNELLQNVKTFSEGLYWGQEFTGDCDCFTIFTLAIFLANNFPESKLAIVLVGDNPNQPRHIYSMVNNKIFDLTNSQFDYERPYKFRQVLHLNQILRK